MHSGLFILSHNAFYICYSFCQRKAAKKKAHSKYKKHKSIPSFASTRKQQKDHLRREQAARDTSCSSSRFASMQGYSEAHAHSSPAPHSTNAEDSFLDPLDHSINAGSIDFRHQHTPSHHRHYHNVAQPSSGIPTSSPQYLTQNFKIKKKKKKRIKIQPFRGGSVSVCIHCNEIHFSI